MVRALRVLALAVGLSAWSSVMWWATRSSLAELRGWAIDGRTPPGGWTVDRLVVDIGAAACATLGLVVTASATLTVLSAYAGAGETARCLRVSACIIGPRWWRGFVLAACGFGITIPSSALADDATDHHDAVGCGPVCSEGLAGLPLPDLPDVSTDQRRSALRPQAWTRPIIVQPGDSLWLISQNQLSAVASDADVAELVHDLYAVNRNVIGHDPDLIYPGQLLHQLGDLHD